REERTTPRQRYEAAVRDVLGLIAEGDCYQINLTRPVHVAGAGDPVDAFRRLRRAPAAYGAFLRLDEHLAVLSNSPELFLEVRGRSVVSDPIKGTRPRGLDTIDDQRLRHELWNSAKDAAELTMIVDLVRNDLSRVCRAGSVLATAREVRAHATVLHTHWPVQGELREGEDALSAVAATFPPGSVTGAPKIRACERIRQLEDEARGVYTGAIGYLADGGDALLSVAIRVAVFDGQDARYHVGGGIVAASDPASEWEETEVKAAALRRALLATAPLRR
ncbi:MAG: anthranilate synthase component I family protein, partial [Myxococcales bacterium]|nr:anthranilate synthase component I family protein [Myxococcales bacterium]